MFVAVVEQRFVLFQDIDTGAVIFGSREAVPFHPFRLHHKRVECLVDLTFLYQGGNRESAFCLGNHEISIRSLGGDKGRIRFLHHLGKAFVYHRFDDILHIVLHQPGGGGIQLFRHLVVLIEYGKDHIGSLLVRSNGNKRFIIVRHFRIFPFGRIYRSRDISKNTFYGRFHLVYIYIPYNDNALQVGAIPFFIIVAKLVRLEVVDHVDRADRHPVCIFVVRKHFRELLFPDTCLGILSRAPFLPDHAPFLFDGRICEGDEARPVVQDQQAGVDNAFAGDRSVHDHVDRFVETCISVEVLTSAHPDAFGKFIHAMPWEVLCSVERHVFKEMGQSALVLVFQDRSDILGDKEIRTVFRLCIVSDVISQPVI